MGKDGIGEIDMCIYNIPDVGKTMPKKTLGHGIIYYIHVKMVMTWEWFIILHVLYIYTYIYIYIHISYNVSR